MRFILNELKLHLQVDIAKVSGNTITKKKYHIDTNALHFPKHGMEVHNYLKDGMIEDWDMFEQVSINIYYYCLLTFKVCLFSSAL